MTRSGAGGVLPLSPYPGRARVLLRNRTLPLMTMAGCSLALVLLWQGRRARRLLESRKADAA